MVKRITKRDYWMTAVYFDATHVRVYDNRGGDIIITNEEWAKRCELAYQAGAYLEE